MESKKIEKFKKTNLYNISNNTYGFLKHRTEEEDRILIEKDFDFDSYKESIRMILSEYSYNFISFVTLNSEETRDIVLGKAKLKEYIDEILDDEELLNSFTVYKIQQFINRVAKNLLESSYENFVTVSKEDKYLVYKDINIDMSKYVGFVSADKVISYLYKEFNLKRMKSEEYSEAFVLKNLDKVKEDKDYLNEINKLLFKAAIDIDDKNHVVINHPVRDNKRIMDYLRDGFIAERTPKRKYKKILKEDDGDILI